MDSSTTGDAPGLLTRQEVNTPSVQKHAATAPALAQREREEQAHAERDEEQLRLEHERWVSGTGEEPHPGARPTLGPETGSEGRVQVPTQLFRCL